MPILYIDASPANVAKIVVPMETAHTMPRARGRIGKDGVLRNDILYWSQLWKEIKDEEEDLGKLPVEELPFEWQLELRNGIWGPREGKQT